MATWNPRINDVNSYVGSSPTTIDQAPVGQYSYVSRGTGFMIGHDQWEPQRTNNFELVIEDLETLNLAGGQTVSPAAAAERIMLSVQSFTAPTSSIQTITTHYANNSIKWAGKPEFQDSSVVINDYIGARVEQLLSAWYRCAYDFKTENVGLARNYKKTAYLIEYAPDGSEARVWKLDGCWISSFELGQWSQDGNAQRQINATFVYDRIIPYHNVDIDSVDFNGSINA